MIITNILSRAGIHVVNQPLILIAARNRLFINPDADWNPMLLSALTPGNGSIQHVPTLIPAKPAKSSGRLDVAFLGDSDHKVLKGKGLLE